MGFLIFGFAILLGLLFRRSRIVVFLLLAALWVLFALNTHNADQAGYEYLYNSYQLTIGGSGQTGGYLLLVQISNAVGLSFQQFKGIIGFVCIMLLYLFIRRYTDNIAFVLALYFLLPFLYDIVQFRFFFATCIALYSLRFIIEEPRRGMLYFIIGMAIAVSIHPASALYGAFLLTKLSSRSIIFVAVVLFAGLLALNYSGLILPIASLFVDAEKYSVYFSKMAQFGFLQYWVSILVMIAIIKATPLRRLDLTPKTVADDGSDLSDSLSCRRDAFARFFYKAGIVYLPLMAFIPLSVSNFYRPIRGSLILFYIFMGIILFEKRSALSKPEYAVICIAFAVWLLFTAYILFSGVWNIVVLDELKYNMLWS